MADTNKIRQSIRDILTELNKLSTGSEEASKVLQDFGQVIRSSLGSGTISDISKFVRQVQELEKALISLGQSKAKVATSIEAVYQGASQFGKTPQLQRLGALAPEGATRAQAVAQLRLNTEREITREIEKQTNKQTNLNLEGAILTRQHELGPGGINLYQHRIERLNKYNEALIAAGNAEREHRKREQQLQEAISKGNVSLQERINILSGVAQNEVRRGQGRRPGPAEGPISVQTLLSTEQARIPGGITGVKNLEKSLKQLGLTNGTVTSSYKELSTGISYFNIQAKDASGQVLRLKTAMDPLGNVLQDTQKRFRSFGSAVGRDILEVTKWTIAIGIVYTPIRAFNRLMTDMIQVQSELADSAVVLGGNTRLIGKAFESVKSIGDLTGTSIAGVVSSYNEAYGAASGAATQSERLAKTTALLRDSMVLAKLAGIDQAEALDTLTGALGQADLKLDQGRRLLDSWQAVAKSANVSINTLASTFAIAGDAARGAGIDYNKLNAIAATLAEKTKLSADETGNALRGFISGFQSSKAEKTLSDYGIAVRDVNGQLRSFVDIMEEIVRLQSAGFLSKKDVQEIANVVGGGWRRGAQLTTLLENYGRVLQLTTVSTNAQGDAEAALAIKVNTVETAITRLNNAVTALAKAFGTEGGLLDVISVTVDGLTQIVNLLDAVVKGMGGATPLILGIGGLLAVRSFQPQFLNRGAIGSAGLSPQEHINARLAGVAGGTAPYAGATGAVPRTGVPLPSYTLNDQITGIETGFVRAASRIGLGTFAAKAGVLGTTAIALQAGSSIYAGARAGGGFQSQRQYLKAGAQIAGGVVGAFEGGPFGAIIGSAIAGGFTEAATQGAADIGGAIAQFRVQAEAGNVPPLTTGTNQEYAQRLQKQIDDNNKQLEDALGITGNATSSLLSVLSGLLGTSLTPEQATLAKYKYQTGQIPQQGNGIQNFLLQGLLGSGFFGGGVAGGSKLSPEEQELIKRSIELDQKLQEAQSGVGGVPFSPTEQKRAANTAEITDLAKQMGNEFVKQALTDLQRGTKTSQQYLTAQSTASTLGQKGGTLLTAAQLSGTAIDTKTLLDTLLRVSSEEQQSLINAAEGVINYRKALDDAKPGTEEYKQAQDGLNKSIENFGQILPATIIAAQTNKLPKLNVTQLADVPQEQAKAIIENAKKTQKLWYEALGKDLDIPPDIIKEMQDRISQTIVQTGSGASASFIKTNIKPEFLTQATQQAGFGGQGYSIQDYRDRLTQAQLPGLLGRYQQVSGTLQNFGYKPQNSDLILLTKDGITQQHLDMTILNLAMQDLIDVNKQQLEGIFNIPEGMTAFIPATDKTYFSNTPFPQTSSSTGGGFPSGTPTTKDQQVAKNVTEYTQEYTKRIVEDSLKNRGPLRSGGLSQNTTANQALTAEHQAYLDRGGRSVYEYNRYKQIQRAPNNLQPNQMPHPQYTPPGGVTAGLGVGDILDRLVSQATNMPASIPITTHVDFKATIPVIINGQQIIQMLQEQLFSSFTNAKRRSGSFGYVVEQ